MGKMKINIEITDTFAGEANYSWVKRESLVLPDNKTELQVIREVKKLVGWNGLKCKKFDDGQTIELRPHGICQVMFITFDNIADKMNVLITDLEKIIEK